ncbi:hypothetical protein DAEQUDRAFT_808419 [Daedalea quercina L-15889]|uniref:Chromatin modification-related protein n=1 Tax=Daedalea quercina L-15889 TaxID=1314783 RepID=A0A165TEF5_9APHY|nr:hypothetical protein DAEQUDRAFT_808419 [Daedalea quercina L-15889]
MPPDKAIPDRMSHVRTAHVPNPNSRGNAQHREGYRTGPAARTSLNELSPPLTSGLAQSTSMSRRAANASASNAMVTAHSLAILGEYTHTLDSLPLDLSRNFAEFRELDAVLSASMSSLTAKINQLTSMLETNTGSKEERLWLLADIAEEATRLKLGSEDKIRVACHAADGLRGHKAHMKTLLQHVPDRDFESIEALCRRTVFPHVAPYPTSSQGGLGEGRRQRRGAYGSLLASSSVDASPQKRKRAVAKDDDSEVVGKTPRKERNVDVARQRNGPRSKRPDRAASPAESLASVASHLQPGAQALSAPHPRQNTSSRAGNGNGASKRSRAAQNHEHYPSTPVDSSHEMYVPPPSASAAHPSLPNPFGHALNGMSEWTPGQLEGPGMPVARSFVGPAVPGDENEGAVAPTGEGEGEGDDGKTYCVCNGVSYGEMIACDDSGCDTEWFHLLCVGLQTPPVGEWYCETCRSKRNGRRAGRGGKKKAGVSYMDLPELANVARASSVLACYAEDPVLHHQRLHVVAPSRVSHSLFGHSSEGVPLRPTVSDLVHRGIMRGLGIERRWRAGMYFYSQLMVSQYEVSLRLQRTHAGNVVESTLRRRSSASLYRVYSARVLPDELPSAAISPSLIPAMRKLKWSIQRDRLAKLVKARSEMVRHGGVVAWLEDRGKAVMRRENERVRLALCPGIGGIVRFYENLSH